MCFPLLADCTDKCTVQDDDADCGRTLKDELPEPRGSLANNNKLYLPVL